MDKSILLNEDVCVNALFELAVIMIVDCMMCNATSYDSIPNDAYYLYFRTLLRSKKTSNLNKKIGIIILSCFMIIYDGILRSNLSNINPPNIKFTK